jgi:L-methionine (R)-S-oxide reductase
MEVMNDIYRRYEPAFNSLKQLIEKDDLKGTAALRAFVDATHKNSPMGIPNFWWCGVYMLSDGKEGSELVLAASSSPACSPLPVRRRSGGVCSDCVLLEKPVVVADVDAYPGHVACDSRASSEMVVPLFNRDDALVGVIDVDDIIHGSFTWDDARKLERFAELLSTRL